MKKHLLLLLGILLSLPASARDFDYTYEGQTITYTVIDEEAKTVSTKAGEGLSTGNYVSGDLILPSVVLDGEIEYTLTEIGERAFLGCSGLTSVVIGNSVTSIGSEAFYGCSGLTSVYYGADKPIAGNNNIFDESTYTTATLYTTENGAHIARTIDPWKNFVNIEKYDFSGIDEIVADNVTAGDIDCDEPYEVYNLSGVKGGNSTDGLAPGLYIVRQGGNAKKLKIEN